MNHIVSFFASLRLTLVIMLALGATALFSHDNPDVPVLWVTLPLVLLAINLLTAIIGNRRFRQQLGLLLFHLGLLVIIILAALGLMISLDARLEITEGQTFDPADVQIVKQGPWHRLRLDQTKFTQGKIEIDYVKALSRGETRSQIWLSNEDGKSQSRMIGDRNTMRAAGYRFIATGNKGYSVILTWLGDDGLVTTGAINMPSFPLYEWKQQNKWVSPTGQPLFLSMKLANTRDLSADSAWKLDSEDLDARLLVKIAGQEQILEAGDQIRLRQGNLRFEHVRMWIGYNIDSNPLLFWQFIAALVAVMGLGFHFYQKFFYAPAVVRNSKDILKITYGKPARG